MKFKYTLYIFFYFLHSRMLVHLTEKSTSLSNDVDKQKYKKFLNKVRFIFDMFF
jgi:hypothetical protein